MRRVLSLFLLLALSTASSAASLDDFLRNVRRGTLPNGLTVITREVPGSGVVAINTWVKAGYFHEPDEVAGMAHLFEHMFFKGSKNFAGEAKISEELASVGGASNAGTIYDTTNYYFILPKEGFARGLEIQADAIANPLFDPAELKKEAEVVIEESNRKLDNPVPVATERMYATMFAEHRMKRWRIGSNEVLRNIKRENLLAFFETLYRPQNMILVVTGDITHAEALREIEKTFGKLPKGKLDKKRGPVEPAQKEFRFGQSSADIRQGYSVLGWHTPGVSHADEQVLNLLAQVLGGGRSSRLFVNAVGPGSADAASAAHFTFEDVGVFQVNLSFDEKNRAEAEKRVLRELERIKTHGPDPIELQAAKNSIESSAILSMEDVLGQSEALGYAEVRGSYRDVAGDLAKMHAVTAQQLVDAAKKFLTVDNMTFYQYRPKSAPESTREAALAFVRENMKAAADAKTASGSAPATGAALRGASAMKAPQQVTLANGATLIVEERPGTPALSIGVYFRGGRIDESSRDAGITTLMTRTLRRGTTSRSGEDIDRQLEFLGTQIETDVQRDYFGLGVSALTRNARPAVEILADVLLNPTFPQKGVDEEKHLQKATIIRAYDTATVRPYQMADQVLFANHPYALPSSGYTTSVDAIDAAALRAWWTKTVNADDAVIVVAGDIATDDARALIESAFAKLPRRTAAASMRVPAVATSGRSEIAEFRDRRQSAIVISFPGVAMSNPDFLRLRLLQAIASGSSGTLFLELRGKRSLAYTVSLQNAGYGASGSLNAYMATDAAKEQEALPALLAELQRLRGEAVTNDNVARAKSYLSGITRLALQTNRAHVGDLARNHLFGLRPDFTIQSLSEIAKLTADDVRAAAAKYLGDNHVTAVVRGKAAAK